jgi:hypothetical protein
MRNRRAAGSPANNDDLARPLCDREPAEAGGEPVAPAANQLAEFTSVETTHKTSPP